MSAGQAWILRRRSFAEAPPAYAGLDPLLARVLYARKIEDPADVAAFLDGAPDQANPFALTDMPRAVARLLWAVHAGEDIVVYGDYDTDGVTATALVLGALQGLGARARAYIPDRFAEAYGLNVAALSALREEGADLVVTVDCGIRSVEEAAHAAAIGLDLIITDHHSVPAALPQALAVIDPKRPDCPYPFQELAGVGLAYRLAQALYAAWNATLPPGAPPAEATQFLDLVALGTVGDIVLLGGENRALVRAGLEALRTTARPGLRALIEASGIAAERLDAQDIAFRLGPRLNAAGRLHNANIALDLLTATDATEGRLLAARLSEINRERQTLLEAQVAAASATLAAEEGDVGDRTLLFVAREDLNEGIVGLIASRLAEQYYRPTLVMRANGEGVRGSARSIEGFHVTEALEACRQSLTRFGGHAMAAGFSLDPENLGTFRAEIEAVAEEALRDSPLLARRIDVDAIVPLSALTLDGVRALAALEPCGEGNPPPALATQGLRILESRAVGQTGAHLRLVVSDGTATLTAIAFRQGPLAEVYPPSSVADAVYTPALNEYNGQVSVQLIVQTLRPAEGARQ